MNFKHELSPSKPLLRSTRSLILGLGWKSAILNLFYVERVRSRVLDSHDAIVTHSREGSLLVTICLLTKKHCLLFDLGF